jgi:hypothetical protein
MNPTKGDRHNYQADGTSTRKILLWIVGLFGALVFTALFTLWFYRAFLQGRDKLGTETMIIDQDPRASMPEPKLQVNPRADLKTLRAEEDQILNNYAWKDQASGAVRIPIERAKELILERGLPARKESPR